MQFFGKQNRLHQIGDAQAGARGLVAVGRPDAAFGRADFGTTFAQLALLVDRAMVGQNQMGAIADEQISIVDLDRGPAQCVHFGNERNGINHDAVADDADFSTAQNAGWNQV